jgi:hypothetical protein
MRRTVRELLEELDTFGNKDTADLVARGVGLARRAGFVTSYRIGPPSPPRLAFRRRSRLKLAWRHELTDAGRAALAEEHARQ